MSRSGVSATGESPFPQDAYNFELLPDHDNDLVNETSIIAFANALTGSDDAVKSPDTASPIQNKPAPFITALNDWRPIRQRVRKDQPRPKRKKRRKPRRGKDETREGFVYTLLKWPLLLFVLTWIICLAAAYALTRLYIWAYESGVTMRGRREALRKRLTKAKSYEEWVAAAKAMDQYLGNDQWKQKDKYAYYNSSTIYTVRNELRRLRTDLQQLQPTWVNADKGQALAEELRTLLEASVKDNFVGVGNARLYSESYYGTKDLVQSFLSEVSASIELLSTTPHLPAPSKSTLFTHLSTNYGRTALCLSGGATFAYYHFGVAKALLEAGSLPNIITGTSGGALVAALLATRTESELKRLLVPALAHRIKACREPFSITARRWWRTGAQFDSIDWARRCAWFCRGDLTFLEAYQLTGRILNITCIPSDPHSPAVLANYLTSPDCVIWSAVLASAAVPGILNPVVLMRKNARTGLLEPYSFGHKWKDGSLRTDIPLKALNTHFNVTYSIVSQVNPHINLFFFSSRGTVGRPVTHRRGRGWRGGFLGSATEQYLKLDLTKWLKVLRHLELLPRYAEQDWSNIWLQRFDGTITIWPKSRASDFWHILSDPDPERLARMLWTGMLSTWPKIKFVKNRMLVEGRIQEGLRTFGGNVDEARLRGSVNADLGAVNVPGMMSGEDLERFWDEARRRDGSGSGSSPQASQTSATTPRAGLADRLNTWWPSAAGRTQSASPTLRHPKRHSWTPGAAAPLAVAPKQSETVTARAGHARRGSVLKELGRQAAVLIDDSEALSGSDESSEADGSESEGAPFDGGRARETTVGGTVDEVREADGEGVGDVVGVVRGF